MDNNSTLRPELVWIDGRCYRFCDSGAWSKDRGTAAYQEESMYLEDDYDSDEDSASEEFDVQPYNGKFKHTFYLAKPFFPFLIGTKGSTRKRLETETSTSIQIPKLGQNGDIVLVGPTRQKVIMARHRIDNLIKTSRKKLYYTHFISIPTNCESVQNGFQKFKESVLAINEPMRGVEEKIFQNPKKMHLTIGMLVLVDSTEREEAVRALEYCKENIIAPAILKNGPLLLTVQGVDYMNDDPAEVNVLYAKVHSKDNVLQELADQISDHFFELGFLRKDADKVNLHITLMNTKFRIPEDDRRGAQRVTFDATKILKAHKDTKFGEFTLSTLHISQLHSESSDGYYEITGKITF
ncbi:activating signal cointegrator 1 complex subunit 1 isoform X1 [Diprion similis]|uniref:activating signal cointegrator 1 complex subunit 1 isoform X1 n=1 Tax=Diprion similis TaxID=362088 RepID=UPI001EF81BC4|nr:activating signal cointegrator 1 complex subunit 1 isoform X1 [Diprion similis]